MRRRLGRSGSLRGRNDSVGNGRRRVRAPSVGGALETGSSAGQNLWLRRIVCGNWLDEGRSNTSVERGCGGGYVHYRRSNLYDRFYGGLGWIDSDCSVLTRCLKR